MEGGELVTLKETMACLCLLGYIWNFPITFFRLYCSWDSPSQLKNLFTRSNVLRNLVPFLQFKKRKKHPWRSVTFSN